MKPVFLAARKDSAQQTPSNEKEDVSVVSETTKMAAVPLAR